MCLLMVCNPKATPTRDELLTACANNPDGFGWAVNTGNKIITGKSFNAEHAVNSLLNLLKKYPQGFGLFHARIATHGSVCIANTHPYKVGGRSDVVMAHNGVLSIEVPEGDDRSDSRVFAEDWLPEIGLGSLDDEQLFSELETLCAGSKIAILTTSAQLKKPVYIINEDLGHWVDGVWWSNHSYKLGLSRWSGLSWIDEDGKAEVWEDGDCMVCGGFSTQLDESICDTCDSCLDCGAFFTDCLCFNRSRLYVPRNWSDNYLDSDDWWVNK